MAILEQFTKFTLYTYCTKCTKFFGYQFGPTRCRANNDKGMRYAINAVLPKLITNEIYFSYK